MARKKTKFGKVTCINLSNQVRFLIKSAGISNLSEYIENLIMKDLNKQAEDFLYNKS